MAGGVQLFCDKCGTGQAFAGNVPVICPECRQVTTWSTLEPYAITFNDARFLKSIHIAAVSSSTEGTH